METKRFTKNDSGFVCENCSFKVLPLVKTSRNHCPKCLCSLHVDIMPGDRSNTCKGLMKPVSCELNSKKGYVIIHKCTKCMQISRNKAALREASSALPPSQYDNLDLLIKLTAIPL